MSNITLSLDDALLQQAQAASAAMNTSVDAVVRNLLAGFVASARTPGGCDGNYRALVEFSLGRTDYRQVMRELRIDSDEALQLLMASAGLPMPKLPKEETMKMVEDCERVLQRGGIMREHLEAVTATTSPDAAVDDALLQNRLWVADDIDPMPLKRDPRVGP